jgi:hypothetical protein
MWHRGVTHEQEREAEWHWEEDDDDGAQAWDYFLIYQRRPLCQDQVRHQGQPLLVELEG